MEGKTIENIFMLRYENTAVRNNGGGFLSIIFWECVTNGGGLPSGELLAAIESSFGSLMNLKLNKKAGATQFGSGWAWLCVEVKLDVCGTPNQDNPLMPGVDVVELNFRNGCLGTCLLTLK
jgi:Fe-Mn family superoxide dismutase